MGDLSEIAQLAAGALAALEVGSDGVYEAALSNKTMQQKCKRSSGVDLSIAGITSVSAAG
jgi:hypothetical protein